jgi:hypothetical protein
VKLKQATRVLQEENEDHKRNVEVMVLPPYSKSLQNPVRVSLSTARRWSFIAMRLRTLLRSLRT